jgi:ketosteroid isomerase-like protein
MSKENVEIVRAIHSAIERGDFEAVLDHLDEDAHFLGTNDVSAGEAGWQGREGVRQGMTRFLAAWEDYRLEAREITDCGEQVYVEGWQTARGRGSGVEISEPLYLLWTIRDGKASSLLTFRDRAEALKAAGLLE